MAIAQGNTALMNATGLKDMENLQSKSFVILQNN